ncbi:MAG: CRISPR-associated protein Cas5 [Candidatus Caldarchaeum sp.]
MRMLAFSAFSFMAHFRRFYSTVTSLSYYFPPRNTIIGLLAAVMGLDKDSYYDLFSRQQCRVAVSLLTPVRKLTQKLNCLDTDDIKIPRFRGIGNRYPTTTELILAEPPHQRVGYAVYFSHENAEVFDELRKRLRSNLYAYPPSLGAACCLADLFLIFDGEAQIIAADGEEFQIHTVIREDLIADKGVVPKEGLKIMREEGMPPDFKTGREISGPSLNFIFEASGKPMVIKVRGEVFHIRLHDRDIYGVFM